MGITIKQLIRDLNAMPTKAVKAAQKTLHSEVPKLIQDFMKRSPVDTGEYKQSWYQKDNHFLNPLIFASTSILNANFKASWMEFGVTPSDAPWYFPNTRKKTGKLIERNGRIWAGGLKPGHSLTIGGAIDPVLYNNNKRQLQIANVAADNFIGII